MVNAKMCIGVERSLVVRLETLRDTTRSGKRSCKPDGPSPETDERLVFVTLMR